MLAQELDTYESWDLESTLPLRSHLYSLNAIGMATPDVESLTSYIARLAQAHQVTVATLIRYKLAPLFLWKAQTPNLSEAATPESAFLTWYRQPLLLQEDAARYWLDKTERVEQVIEILEQLTLQQELRYLTLIPWHQFFSLQGLFRTQQLWCPACYQEWRDSESIVYEPLLWAFELVEVCPRHQRYLQTWCLYCHSPQPFLKLKAKLGFCSECGAWLGRWVQPLPQPRPKAEKWDWYLWVAQAIGQLLAATSLSDKIQTFHYSQSTQSRRKLQLKVFLKQCYRLKSFL